MRVKVEKGKFDEKGMDMCHLGGKRAQNYQHCIKLTECVLVYMCVLNVFKLSSTGL